MASTPTFVIAYGNDFIFGGLSCPRALTKEFTDAESCIAWLKKFIKNTEQFSEIFVGLKYDEIIKNLKQIRRGLYYSIKPTIECNCDMPINIHYG